MRRFFGACFALSSLATPFFLGTVAGGVASSRVPPGASPGDVVISWLNPTSILGGVLAVLVCAYLAAVFLCLDARREGHDDLADQFRTRALGTAASDRRGRPRGHLRASRRRPAVVRGPDRARAAGDRRIRARRRGVHRAADRAPLRHRPDHVVGGRGDRPDRLGGGPVPVPVAALPDHRGGRPEPGDARGDDGRARARVARPGARAGLDVRAVLAAAPARRRRARAHVGRIAIARVLRSAEAREACGRAPRDCCGEISPRRRIGAVEGFHDAAKTSNTGCGTNSVIRAGAHGSA